MLYDELVRLLQSLERKWRAGVTAPDAGSRWPCHGLVREGRHAVQYFACSDRTALREESLPVVVAVGVNYTQDRQLIPEEAPRYSVVAREGPRVEDRIRGGAAIRTFVASFNRVPEVWKGPQNRMASPTLASGVLQAEDGGVRDFHLVMINFSPWITKKSWMEGPGVWRELPGDLDELRAELLRHPPHVPAVSEDPFGHLVDLRDALGDHAALWVGHGREVVWPIFRALAAERGLDRWLLTANTSRPNKVCIAGGRIMFKLRCDEGEAA